MAWIAIMGRRRKAVLLLHDEVRDEEGWRIVVKVWSVPVSTTSPQGVDYSLALISPEGKRVVGYDNHWPKGHHRHFLGQEEEYAYRDVDRLIADFHADVMRVKRRPS
jgi:hypothetical protein